MNFIKIALPALMLALPLSSQADIIGKVVRVLDGDTVEILADGKLTRVRLNGIDAPEKAQPYGQKSKEMLVEAIAGKQVEALGNKLDRYGRMLAKLVLNGRDINAMQVQSGMAWVYRYKGNAMVPAYLRYEQDARMARRGLWEEKEPVEPAIWRHQHN